MQRGRDWFNKLQHSCAVPPAARPLRHSRLSVRLESIKAASDSAQIGSFLARLTTAHSLHPIPLFELECLVRIDEDEQQWSRLFDHASWAGLRVLIVGRNHVDVESMRHLSVLRSLHTLRLDRPATLEACALLPSLPALTALCMPDETHDPKADSDMDLAMRDHADGGGRLRTKRARVAHEAIATCTKLQKLALIYPNWEGQELFRSFFGPQHPLWATLRSLALKGGMTDDGVTAEDFAGAFRAMVSLTSLKFVEVFRIEEWITGMAHAPALTNLTIHPSVALNAMTIESCIRLHETTTPSVQALKILLASSSDLHCTIVCGRLDPNHDEDRAELFRTRPLQLQQLCESVRGDLDEQEASRIHFELQLLACNPLNGWDE